MKRPRAPSAESLFAPRKQRKVPFAFVLDELAALAPSTRPMFGCTAVYVGERIVLVLRDRPAQPGDNGVWLATTAEHHASLRQELPSLRSIRVFGDGETGWQVLPSASPDFEDEVLRACALVVARDPRIGKLPKPRRAKPPGAGRDAKPSRGRGK